jgi:imidazolonepropionase-like amidohydrolase
MRRMPALACPLPRVSEVHATLVLAGLLLCAVPPLAQTEQNDLVITGATLIDGTGAPPRKATTIIARRGRIIAVAADGEIRQPKAARVIDAAGKYVIPGLADMHVHFGLGTPLPRRAEETAEVLARCLYYGVTSILNLGASDASTESIRTLRARRAAGTLQAPYIYGTGGHLTVPGTHPVFTIMPARIRQRAESILSETPPREPANLYTLGLGISLVRTSDAARKAVRERASGGMDAVKITIESGPPSFGDNHPLMPVEMIRAIVDEAERHSLPVFAHVTSPHELALALDGGTAGVVHAVVDRPLPDAALARRMAAKRFTYVPTLTLFEGWARYPADLNALDDPFLRESLSDEAITALREPRFVDTIRRRADAVAGAPGADPSRHVRDVLSNVGILHQQGVPMAVGTDTANPFVFPGYSVHRELELLVRAGLTPMKALQAGTRRAAEMLRADDAFGTIEAGKRADLLILDANPLDDIRNTRTLKVVVSEGRVVDRVKLLEKPDK